MARRKRIDINKLPSNNRSTPNRKQVEPIELSGRVYVDRKSSVANGIRNIGNSLFAEIVMPRTYDIAGDFLHGAIDMILSIFRGGQSGYGMGHPGAVRKNYNEPYSVRPTMRRRRYGRSPEPRQFSPEIREPFEDVYFRSRRDAEQVLGQLMSFIVEYNAATVGDLYSLSGLDHSPNDQLYGWDNLQGVRVEHTNHGFLIGLPEAIYLR